MRISAIHCLTFVLVLALISQSMPVVACDMHAAGGPGPGTMPPANSSMEHGPTEHSTVHGMDHGADDAAGRDTGHGVEQHSDCCAQGQGTGLQGCSPALDCSPCTAAVLATLTVLPTLSPQWSGAQPFDADSGQELPSHTHPPYRTPAR